MSLEKFGFMGVAGVLQEVLKQKAAAKAASQPDPTQPISEAGQRVEKVTHMLDGHPFWIIQTAPDERMIYDAATRLLWNATPTDGGWIEGKPANSAAVKLGGWRKPEAAELQALHAAPDNPGLSEQFGFFRARRVWQANGAELTFPGNGAPQQDATLGIIEVSDAFAELDELELMTLCVERHWSLLAAGAADAEDVLAQFSSGKPLREQLRGVDYLATHLPVLDDAQFDDPTRGMWECWGMNPALLRLQGIRARNPVEDIRDWDVAIDFGTSSTVVAINEHGRRQLLRVGIGNFHDTERASNYENPTMLEFLDWQGLLREWRGTAYRPGVSWDQVRCSHAALGDFQRGSKDLTMVASLLTNIKQWSLHAAQGERRFITDRKQVEYELAAPATRNPVLGQPLTVSEDDPFDPVELYAWLLGLNINWRGRGLFLRYTMTFPVDYPVGVKDQILASFRRGLQRSLPETLVRAPEFSGFSVEELASEPLAYAIAALPALKIEPTAEGVAYSVFDFGGGTADFDFGLYRLPGAEEDEELEQILERKGVAGDRNLGGESLLAHMAYRAFRDELNKCVTHGLVFTRPIDAETFPGHERVLRSDRLARANTVAMMEALRPLWENGDLANTTLSLSLYNGKGERGSYNMVIAKTALLNYLEQRIGQGVRSFLVSMQQAFSAPSPSQIEVLLAGNSSRSRIVQGYFGLHDDKGGEALHEQTQAWMRELFGEQPPTVKVHPALAGNSTDLMQPTAKTGVALGLLRLLDRDVVKVIDASPAAEDEAPFAYYVGRIRQGKFQAQIPRGVAYRQWVELGRPRERVLKISYTHSPLGQTGEMREGAPELLQKRLEFPGDVDGQLVFARAVGPAEIELCTAASREEIDPVEPANSRRLTLH